MVFRLGRRPDPWAWPDWRYADADGTFGNRFDDPQGVYRVLYASTQRLATFVECLASFRPDPAIVAEYAAIDAPMTKRREAHANWYATPFDERNDMMREHGKSGRTFAGKIVQLITGSTGLDDFEWGVTLFATTPEVVKDVVYTMRFDKGSALYGEFGRFYVGYLADVDDVLDGMGR